MVSKTYVMLVVPRMKTGTIGPQNLLEMASYVTPYWIVLTPYCSNTGIFNTVRAFQIRKFRWYFIDFNKN